MQAESWLRLTDYASKYRVSISTLRRRIKSGDIRYRFDDGKYLILDDGTELPAAASPDHSVPPAAMERAASIPAPTVAESRVHASEEPILSSATRLLSELKRAYTNILQEKEEQLIQLKEEVSDLKTLVRVLEDDNDRMRRILRHTEGANS